MLQAQISKAADSRLTTVTGYVVILVGILLPAGGQQCLDSILASTNPLVSGVVLGIGAILTGLGPSLKPKQ